MKTQRLRIAALVLAAALCSAACSPTEPAANGSNPGEMPATVNANTSGAGGGVAGQPAQGSDVAAQGAATPQTRPFLVLISGPNCQYCNPLSGEMEKLRGEGAARMDFHIFDIGDATYAKAVADAGRLGVTIKDDSLDIDRTKKLPWAAVFVPGNQGPSAQKPFVNGVTTGAEFEAAVKTLQTGAEVAQQQRTPKPERAGANPEETARLTEARLDERLKALKSELATDSGFQQTLLTNEGFKKKLAEDPAFRESLLKDPTFKERLANDTGFRAGLSLPPADSVDLKTVLSYAALGLFPLLALGVGGWGFWKARGVDLKLRQEASRTAAWESRWRKRTRRSRGALSRVIRKLRADVKHVGERVDAAAGAGSGVTANADPREAARGVLNDVVSALAEPRSGQHSPETVATATKLWGVIDGSVAPIRLRLGVQTEGPNRGRRPTWERRPRAIG